MAIILFRCPNTGYRVQGWFAEDVSETDDDTYEFGDVSSLPADAPSQSEDRESGRVGRIGRLQFQLTDFRVQAT